MLMNSFCSGPLTRCLNFLSNSFISSPVSCGIASNTSSFVTDNTGALLAGVELVGGVAPGDVAGGYVSGERQPYGVRRKGSTYVWSSERELAH